MFHDPVVWPTITVVIANHSGRHHLARLLPSLRSLTYPPDRFRTIVVDDASIDDSVTFLADHFPEIQIVRLAQNQGFAAASNAGFAAASSEYVVALNNDTIVTPNWLAELVRPVLDDSTVGICTGKLLFVNDRLRVTVRRSDGNQPLLGEPHRAWLDGQSTAVERIGSPSPTYLELGLAVEPGMRPREIRVDLGETPGTSLNVRVGGGTTTPEVVTNDGSFTSAVTSEAVIRSVVQNAGLIVFRDGRGRDRGAVAGPGYHYWQDDLGQFDRVEEVFAGCGASLLIRAAALKDVGAFDERFFAYYEDVDLSWRARLRGWRIVYAPGAVVRHAHRGTTAEWSGAFVYYTERNRLMLLVKLAPADRVLAQLSGALLRVGRSSLAAGRQVARGRDPRGTWVGPRWAGLASVARQLPALLDARARLQVRRSIPQPEIDRWLLVDEG